MKSNYQSPSDIKVGVVGYGGAFNMGREHLNAMKAAGMTPVAVAEKDPARLVAAAADYPGIGTFRSLPGMLRRSEVNLVVLITPHNTHAPLALQCLRAGRHVVCEKPLAITTAEVDAMISTARRHRRMLSTYHNRHWDGCILEAVRQIKEKKVIGDVVRIEAHMGGYGKPGDWWRTSRRISGGILYDWGVHLLEYSFQLIDSPLAEVSGFAHSGFWAPKTAWGADTNEDEARAVVRFKSGQWLTLNISQLDSKGTDGWLEITGTEGTYVFDGGTHRIYSVRDGVRTVVEAKNPASQSDKYYSNIADHLVKGTPLVITPEWSRRPIHVLDLARKSAKLGRALPVRYR